MQLIEGQLEFTFNGALNAIKFDDEKTHGVSEMKAVDFIIEFPDHYLFVEVKDPDCKGAVNPDKFKEKLKSGELKKSVKYKYRDSFLYRWASNKVDKPIDFVLIIELASLTPRNYQLWTDKLRRCLPRHGPKKWNRQIVRDVFAMNTNTWNATKRWGTVKRI